VAVSPAHSHTRARGRQDVFSLLAYPDPSSSPIAAMVSEGYRASLANLINGAVMGTGDIDRAVSIESTLSHSPLMPCHRPRSTIGLATCVEIGTARGTSAAGQARDDCEQRVGNGLLDVRDTAGATG